MRNFTFLFCLTFCFLACQPKADSDKTAETTQIERLIDVNETTPNTNAGSFSAYDLSSFSCMIEGEQWQPDLAFARVHYSAKNDIDSIL